MMRKNLPLKSRSKELSPSFLGGLRKRAAAAGMLDRHGQRATALRYLDERKEFYDRWIGTFAHFRTAPLSLYWGVPDPVAVIAMADRTKTWSPRTDLYKIEESGHWPSIEVPDIISDAILARLPLYR